MINLSSLFKTPVYTIADHLISGIEYTTRLFEENYMSIQNNNATPENYFYTSLLGFAIYYLPIAGAKSRWIATLTLLTAVVFSLEEKLIIELDKYATTTMPALKHISGAINNFTPTQMFFASILFAIAINILFNQLMYFIVFLAYVSVLIAITLNHGDESIASNGSIYYDQFLKHPFIIISIVYLLFYFFEELLVSISFGGVGVLMVGLISECIFQPKDKKIKEFLEQLKKWEVKNDSDFIIWGIATFIFVSIQYNLFYHIKYRLSGQNKKPHRLVEFIDDDKI